jgi:hypothetical protein
MTINYIPLESKSGFRSRGFSVDPAGNLTVKSLTIRNIDDPDSVNESIIFADSVVIKGVQILEGGDSTLIALGNEITASSLTRLGTLEFLNIDGDLRVSEGSTPYFNVVDGHIEMNSFSAVGSIDNFNIGETLPGTGAFTTIVVGPGAITAQGSLTVVGNSTLSNMSVSGNVAVALPPTEVNHLTRKDYVDARVSAFAIAFGA